MWLAALRIIPRLNKDEWDKLDPIAQWLVATRGATLIMTFLSATFAALFAAVSGGVNLFVYALLAVGLVLAHGSSNLLNDYWDYREGVDTDNYFRAQYGPHPILAGLMTPRRLLAWSAGTGIIAILIAAYLAILRGPWVLAFTLAGAAFMLLYAGKPFPLKRIGLGEVVVFITWGPLMIGGSYYVLTGTVPGWVLVASLPYTLGVTSVLFGKHIDKIREDAGKSIRTLPVLLGEHRAREGSILLIILMYAVTVLLIVTRYLSIWLLLVLLALPSARLTIKALRSAKPTSPPEGYPKEAWPLWFVGFTFIHNRNFGILFMLALILDLVARTAGFTLLIPPL